MISHKHKCIFIHIPKCAGSSVEKAFDLYNSTNEANYDSVTGWCDNKYFFMQHATPQQLLDYGLITEIQWNTYYKFIIYRNSWDKAFSDYLYIYEKSNLLGRFSDYLNGDKEYFNKMNILNRRNESSHLLKQIDYMYLNNEIINYDLVIDFKNIKLGFEILIQDLQLNQFFFSKRLNESFTKIKHYSLFYNEKRKKMIANKYVEDIDFFKFKFEDKKTNREKWISKLNSHFIIKNFNKLNLTKSN